MKKVQNGKGALHQIKQNCQNSKKHKMATHKVQKQRHLAFSNFKISWKKVTFSFVFAPFPRVFQFVEKRIGKWTYLGVKKHKRQSQRYAFSNFKISRKGMLFFFFFLLPFFRDFAVLSRKRNHKMAQKA